jgi:6-phosphogluconolactonase
MHYARAMIRAGSLLACLVPLIAGCGHSGGSSTTTSSSTAGSGGATTTSSATTGGSGGTGGTGGAKPAATVPYVYVGADDDTISVFVLDRTTGDLAPKGSIAAGSNPSFLATDPTHRRIYAVNEGSGEVAAFAIDPSTGLLTFLDRKSSQGDGPAYVSVDGSGAWALVANYGGGTVAVLPILADGSLGDAVDVQAPGTNPHLIRTDPTNRFAFVPSKGSDLVAQFLFDPQTGKLAPNSPPSVATAAGAGPRHLEFNHDHPVVYVIDELGDAVGTYALDAQKGTLTPAGSVSTLPAGADGASNYAADLHLRPDGRFLYGSNRGDDSIAIFAVDAATGAITPAGHQPTGGTWPRNFGIDPEGGVMLVANQNSSNVVTFRIDAATGALAPLVTTPTSGKPAWVGVITQPAP